MTAADVDPIVDLIDELADAVWAGDGSSDDARAALVAAAEDLRRAPHGRGTVRVDPDDLPTALACMRWVRLFKHRTWRARWETAYERLFAALGSTDPQHPT